MLDTAPTVDTRINLVLLVSMGLLATIFVYYAANFGASGLVQDLSAETHLYTAGADGINSAIFSHMITGAMLTLLAPLQLLTPLRQRYPVVHRWTGYLFFIAALITAIAGLGFIVAKRTIGGPVMDVAFAAYGACVLVCSIQTVRYARARNFTVHREWALRIFVLAIGSWLYRMQYGLWFAVMGETGTGENFSGPFDYFQDFAFFVPYLIGVEVYVRAQRRRERVFSPTITRGLALTSIAALALSSYAFYPIFTG